MSETSPNRHKICVACRRELPSPDSTESACWSCQERLPASLLKACVDRPWDYALRLRDGTIFRFTGADIEGEWAHLEFDESVDFSGDVVRQSFYLFDRGVDVRIADVVWCADSPMGA